MNNKIKVVFAVLAMFAISAVPVVFAHGNGNHDGDHQDNNDDTGEVVLAGSALGEFHLNNCPLITALLKNTSDQPEDVLIDFELRSANGTLVHQQFFNNYSVPSTKNRGPVSLANTCQEKLADGQYFYSIGIFEPDWDGLIHWYDRIKTFTVAVGSEVGDVFLSNARATRTDIPQGQTMSLVATVTNFYPSQKTILVDLELYNSSNTKAYQLFGEINISAGGTNTFTASSPSTIPKGNYRWAVGLFTPGWTSLTHWYNTAQTIRVL
jgi:hypothetical protein